MAISQFPPAGAPSSSSNDFTLVVGGSGDTTYVLDRTYNAGHYQVSFLDGDTTYDIYFIAEDGSYAGYTNSSVAEVSSDFSKVVVLGATSQETILFTYDGAAMTPTSAGDIVTAGAFANSVVTSSLPNIDDTTVVNGGNFAADVEVSFIDQSDVETAAKNVVRSSSTQLIATRPDSFSPDNSPYTVKVLNPGIPAPSGSNSHLLSNAVTAGTNPTWVTDANIYYDLSAATSITLLATDTEGSDIDYSIVTGSLPAGLSLDGETGIISGTFSGSAVEGDSVAITFRATDAGGNFLDKSFSLIANSVPVWTTPSGALTVAPKDEAYSYQLVASGGSAATTLTYSIQSGSLPSGLSLNSATGEISGTADTAEVASFTVRVTDDGQMFADRSFSITVAVSFSADFLVIAGGGGGGFGELNSQGYRGGGGGAGGYRTSAGTSGELSSAESQLLLLTGTSYTCQVGAGGGNFGNGVDSIFDTVTSVGGGRGARADFPNASLPGDGGSGGGASSYGQTTGGAGTPNQGFSGGGTNSTQSGAAGGGGAGQAGIDQSGNSPGGGGAGIASSITGSSVIRAGGGGGAWNTGASGGAGGGGAGASGNTGNIIPGEPGDINTGSGGGGGAYGNSSVDRNGGPGGSGIIVLKYPNTVNAVPGAGLVTSTTTSGAYKITQITAGADTISFEAA